MFAQKKNTVLNNEPICKPGITSLLQRCWQYIVAATTKLLTADRTDITADSVDYTIDQTYTIS